MNDNVRDEKAPVPSDATLALLPCAAAVLTPDLKLLRANPAFLALCLAPAAKSPLASLLKPAGAPLHALSEGAEVEYLAFSAAGEPVSVHLSRRGPEVGAFACSYPESELSKPLARAMRSLQDQELQQEALLSLSREVALAGSEDELVAAIGACVRRLLPGRCFCVRTVDTQTGQLTSMYSEGRLLPGSRERFSMRRSAAEKAHLDPKNLLGRVALTEHETLVFSGTDHGFATPLAAAGQFFGLLNLEYPVGLAADAARDERLLIQLANQAAVGVRNAKLIEELTLVRKNLEELIENANALILVANRRHEVLVFNRALVELVERPGGEVIGRPVDEVLAPDAREGFGRVLDKSLRGERVNGHETALYTSKGAERRATFNTSAVLDASGEIQGVIAIGQDLSRQKELERRVVQAEKLATLGQLAAGVVHEINNPLSTITMYTEALLQLAPARHTEPTDLEKLKRIKESADRILKFARDLTNYARPAASRTEDVHLHDLLDQALRYCEPSRKSASAEFVRSYGKVPVIRGVRANLVQVFVNLLTNACHALPPTGGKVEVVTRERPDTVEIEVRDSGSGIAPRDLPRIFEPFFTTKPEGRGTGLGLTIVQGIVGEHGGTIHVTSDPGAGTCFSVRLPINPTPL